ncbi:YkvA family protein [Bosea sp. 117]|uniref:YkvA family protein n=1 Tax=Bosea sp. 117 TaxID=1125973 RepID=UPI000689FBB1|nr:YkvA family protein [Bosea sp. 117]
MFAASQQFFSRRFFGTADDEKKVRSQFWKKLRGSLARIPFAEDVTAAYYCALDSATPVRVRAMLFGALAYFVLPADSVPDFLPVLGFTDDAAVIAAALNLLAGHLRPEHRVAAREALDRLSGR